MTPSLLTVEDVAARLGVSRRTETREGIVLELAETDDPNLKRLLVDLLADFLAGRPIEINRHH